MGQGWEEWLGGSKLRPQVIGVSRVLNLAGPLGWVLYRLPRISSTSIGKGSSQYGLVVDVRQGL